MVNLMLLFIMNIFIISCYAQRKALEKGKLLLSHFPEIRELEHDFGVIGTHGVNRPDLWVKGAEQIFPQLNSLIDFVSPGYKVNVLDIDEGLVRFNYTKNYEKVSQLGDILNSCGSDKAGHHGYHTVYAYIFEELRKTKSHLRTLEIGMGTNKTTYVSTMGVTGKPGASLHAFSKYLPDADVFGADIDSEILFQSKEDRIRTTFVDGYNYSTYETLYEAFDSKRFDLIIDDAAHSIPSELNTLLFGLSHVNVPGWIVIEDLLEDKLRAVRVIDYLLKSRMSNRIDVWTTVVFTKEKSLLYVVSLQPKGGMRMRRAR